jgi:tRNA pseudouridine38-40 synthase
LSPSRFAAKIAYNGRDFHGFAPQPGLRTVAGALADAISTLTSEKPSIACAGRTDSGVHAWGQVVHFDLENAVDPSRLKSALNGLLRPTIAVRDVRQVEGGFHARHSAQARRYLYFLAECDLPQSLLPPFVARARRPLRIELMQSASLVLHGEHDFSAFCKTEDPDEPGPHGCRRRVELAQWHQRELDPLGGSAGADMGSLGRLLCFEIVANAFCRNMVRALVGTLIRVGEGRLTPAGFWRILREGAKEQAGPTAPPEGLVLASVRYDGKWW